MFVEAPSTSHEIKQEELEFDEVRMAIHSSFSQNVRGYSNWSNVQKTEKRMFSGARRETLYRLRSGIRYSRCINECRAEGRGIG